MTKYLVLDTETGGLDPQNHSLLEVAGVLWEPGAKLEPLFEFYVKEPEITVTPGAMKVNRIDLQDVMDKGLSPTGAVEEIRRWLYRRFGGKQKQAVIMAGHNIGFDVSFIKRMYGMTKHKYSHDFRGHSLDTFTIMEFLVMCGKLPKIRCNSDNLFKVTGVTIPEEHRHRAMGDALGTAQALENFYQRFGVGNDK